MASNEENWIGDTVSDFTHSSIWLSSIQTIFYNHYASFDIDEENSSSTLSMSNVEEKIIYQNHQKMTRSIADRWSRRRFETRPKFVKRVLSKNKSDRNGRVKRTTLFGERF